LRVDVEKRAIQHFGSREALNARIAKRDARSAKLTKTKKRHEQEAEQRKAELYALLDARELPIPWSTAQEFIHGKPGTSIHAVIDAAIQERETEERKDRVAAAFRECELEPNWIPSEAWAFIRGERPFEDAYRAMRNEVERRSNVPILEQVVFDALERHGLPKTWMHSQLCHFIQGRLAYEDALKVIAEEARRRGLDQELVDALKQRGLDPDSCPNREDFAQQRCTLEEAIRVTELRATENARLALLKSAVVARGAQLHEKSADAQAFIRGTKELDQVLEPLVKDWIVIHLCQLERKWDRFLRDNPIPRGQERSLARKALINTLYQEWLDKQSKYSK
jgi:hypothetical protein